MMKWTMNSFLTYFTIIILMSPQLRAQNIDPELINIIDIEKNIQLQKEKKPTVSRLELGIGYGFGSIADYPASDEYSRKFLTLPLIIYRGDVVKSDQEDGTRAELFKSTELEINMSFGARFNNESENNNARKGMPNLNYLIETGPSLNYKLYRNPGVSSVRLQLPVRLTLETDFKRSEFLGFVFEPELRYQRLNFLVDDLTASTSVAVELFSERVANYYYQVENLYATSERPVYDGKAGIASVSLGQSFLYEYNAYNFIFGANHSYFGNSANRSSPLYKSDTNTSVFVAVAWFFYRSTKEK